jgi:succinoglycan biosynthesis protein ExoV
MDLFYHRDDRGNFGDDLNEWLWPKYIPNLASYEVNTSFVGIGTLINHKLPKGKKIIFGSGFGYGEVPQVDDSWEIHAVRGPKTAEKLGVSPELAITDPAILLADCYEKPHYDNKKIGFIPHSLSCYYGDWQPIADTLGLELIDPKLSVDEFLDKLSQCDKVICEAMHGAIAADALRIPWKPLVIYPYIFEFKWQDWAQSLGMDYNPVFIDPIWDTQRHFSFKQHCTYQVKKILKSVGIWSSNFSELPEPQSSIKQRNKTQKQLKALVQSSEDYYLSEESIHLARIDQIKTVIQDFNKKYPK